MANSDTGSAQPTQPTQPTNPTEIQDRLFERLNVEPVTVSVADILPFEPFTTSPSQRSVETLGNLGTVTFRRQGDKFEVVDGRRRIQWMLDNGYTEIDGRTLPENADPASVALATLGLNMHRSNLLNEAEQVRKLLRSGFTEKEISQSLGIDAGTIRNRVAITGAPQWAWDAAVAGEAAPTLLAQMVTLTPEQIQELRNLYEERRNEGKKRCLLLKDLAEVRRRKAESVLSSLPVPMFEVGDPAEGEPEVRVQVASPEPNGIAMEPIRPPEEVLAQVIRISLQGGMSPQQVREIVERSLPA